MSSDIERFLLPQSHTIRQGMERLEQTEEKIVFVVDDASRLVGSLTDGDIRRWILSDGDLTSTVLPVCNRAPYVVHEAFDPERVRQDMVAGHFTCVPVVDAGRRVVRLLWRKGLLPESVPARPTTALSVPVVIMAGGRGTRLDPFTKVLPKPLIPVGDRTVIEVIIGQFLPYGLKHFHLSVNYKSKIIKSFFEELAPPYSLTYVEEEEPLGTAGSLRALYTETPESMFVTNCDIIVRADYAELIAFHEAEHHDLTLVASLKEYRIPYGICELEKGGALGKILEKPQYNFLVNTGMYVVRRNRLSLIRERERCDMPTFMERIKQAGGRVGVFPIGAEAWLDIGQWAEYRKALDLLGRLADDTGHVQAG
jgi:dTDP-glucose pyrophosphorylase